MNLMAQSHKVQLAEASYAENGYVELPSDNSLQEDLTELREMLQNAMVLEHATIPPYLTMLYTLSEDTDWRITETIRSVVVEEMLHFTLAANLLNAIGGTPNVASAGFMPDYPATLPYGIDAIEIHLYGFSRNAVFQAMVIEHPKDIRPAVVASEQPEKMTIGEFYAWIEARLRAAVEKHGELAIFCGDPARQVPSHAFYYGGGGNVHEISGLEGALKAIDLITDQGEGTPTNIKVEDEDELAHYFRFNQLYKERLYTWHDTAASGPTGDDFPVPWDKAVMLKTNAKVRDYPPGEVQQALIRFNYRYTQLLATLQDAFNGQSDKLLGAVVAMCSLRDDFRAITANPFPGDPILFSCPTFEYTPLLDEALSQAGASSAEYAVPPAAAALQTDLSTLSGQQAQASAPQQRGCPFSHGVKNSATSTGATSASADAQRVTAASSSNQQTLDRLQQAYSTGDLALALSCMSDSVIWDISGPSECPYFGVFYGHTGFSRFWTLLGETVQFGSAGAEQSLFDGNFAVSWGGEQGRVKSTGAPYHYDWAVRYVFDEQHLITSMRQYFNTLNILSALKAAPYPAQAVEPQTTGTRK